MARLMSGVMPCAPTGGLFGRQCSKHKVNLVEGNKPQGLCRAEVEAEQLQS